MTAATRGINKCEKHLLRRTTPHLTLGSVERLFTFRQPSLLLITESALYKLVLRSRRKEAEDFQNWVTRVVLPAIRKDGGYIHGEEHVVSGAMSEDELVISISAISSAETVRCRVPSS